MEKSKHVGRKEVDVTVPIPQLDLGKSGVGELMNQINDLTVLVNALIKGDKIKPTTQKKEE